MKRPQIQDARVNKYVTHLQEKIDAIESRETEAKAYLALKHFIETNSTTLKDVEMSADMISDKDDKMVDRASKFFKDLGGLLLALKDMRKELTDKEIEEADNKFVKKTGYSVEESLANGNL